MKHLLIAALLSVPLLAQADAYRCRQPNGSLSFQDHACTAGAQGSAYGMPTVQGYTPRPIANPQTSSSGAATSSSANTSAHNAEADRTNQQAKVYAEQLQASLKESRCSGARHDLGALKEQRPVFTRDDNGNRVYLEDKDRAAATAAAQEILETDCQ